eukprot:3772357-Amphidinium_carterae.1
MESCTVLGLAQEMIASAFGSLIFRSCMIVNKPSANIIGTILVVSQCMWQCMLHCGSFCIVTPPRSTSKA